MAMHAPVIFSFFLLCLDISRAGDIDNDGISDDKDSCPFDQHNDKDGDNMCAVEFCLDEPEFAVPLSGVKCSHFGPGNPGHGKCKQYQNDGIADVCSSCACTCAHEVACGFDPCPDDAQNDADNDGICGDIDSCPLDKDNDADSDGICGNADPCIVDRENDVDSDSICGNLDSCPYDAENDADNDLVCGNEDSCPFDALNDIDGDTLCDDEDSCPMDPNNDADSDNLCAVTNCFDSPKFGSRNGYGCSTYANEPNRCAPESVRLPLTNELDVCVSCGCACAYEVACGFDMCPFDNENDVDNDNLCANEDVCPNDSNNDADSDNICGDVDSCPMDRENDADSDQLCDVTECVDVGGFVSATGYTCAEYAVHKGYCRAESTAELDVCTACGCACAEELACGGSIDFCPSDAHNDEDSDNLCGDVDECPSDTENDADSDNLCADKDICPNDASNDIDSDNICGQVDSCPMDRENDADGDKLCDVAQCVDVQDFVSHSGYTCGEYAAGKGSCKADSTALLDVCMSCGCACAHDSACGGSIDICVYDAENDADNDNLCGDVDACPFDQDNDIDSDNLCADVDVCPEDASNDVDSDNICGLVDSCPMDRGNDVDADGICGDQDECPHDAENDFDGDMICADADPCPYDFRPAVDGRCSEERLRFSQLDSLQALRETFPAAESDDCLWSGAEKAAEFDLEFVQCIRAAQVFRLNMVEQTLFGELAITANIHWGRGHEEHLAKYIASVARVVPSRISFSRDEDSFADYTGIYGGAMNQDNGHRSLLEQFLDLHTVTIRVSIKIYNLPFRPLRCRDPGACNFNEDVTEQFSVSSSSSINFCIYAQTCKSASTTTSIMTSKSQEKSASDTVDGHTDNNCNFYYLYMGVGIGLVGSISSMLLCACLTYCVLHNKGYRLKKFQSQTKPTSHPIINKPSKIQTV